MEMYKYVKPGFCPSRGGNRLEIHKSSLAGCSTSEGLLVICRKKNNADLWRMTE